MRRAIRVWLLRHRRRFLLDDIDNLRGVEALGRRKLAELLHSIRNRETRIGAIDRELARIDAPRSLIERAMQRRSA